MDLLKKTTYTDRNMFSNVQVSITLLRIFSSMQSTTNVDLTPLMIRKTNILTMKNSTSGECWKNYFGKIRVMWYSLWPPHSPLIILLAPELPILLMLSSISPWSGLVMEIGIYFTHNKKFHTSIKIIALLMYLLEEMKITNIHSKRLFLYTWICTLFIL